LEASSKQVLVIGEVGQATAIKIATNMVTAASVQAAAEAMALAHAMGVPVDKFAAALEGNASNSTTLRMKMPKMLERKFDPHFSVKHMLKDMQIASRLGLSHHLELAVTAAARDRLLEQSQQGNADADYSSVVRKYFPDAPKKNADQSDLELFEKRPAPAAVTPTPAPSPPEPVPTAAATPAAPIPAPVTEEKVPNEPPTALSVSASPEPAPDKLSVEPEPPAEGFPHHMMPSSFSVSAMEAAAAPTPTNGDSVAVEAEDILNEPSEGGREQTRGFFSRLLRR